MPKSRTHRNAGSVRHRRLAHGLRRSNQINSLSGRKRKTYEFTLKFGTGTTTDDTEGEICAVSSHLPDAVAVNGIISRFTGTINQIPPKFSAIHINGQRAYELARSGKEFTVPARQITIRELKCLAYRPAMAEADFSVTCSKGTYVRTLGHDIAESLGTCGHLTALRRTQNGFLTSRIRFCWII